MTVTRGIGEGLRSWRDERRPWTRGLLWPASTWGIIEASCLRARRLQGAAGKLRIPTSREGMFLLAAKAGHAARAAWPRAARRRH
jgi:hypothetical protein